MDESEKQLENLVNLTEGNSSPEEKSENTPQDSTEPPPEQPSEQSRENTLEGIYILLPPNRS